MADLLKVTDIVVGIASQLSTKDYLSFRQVNKEVYHEHLSETNDARIWSSKLKELGLHETENEEKNTIAHPNAANIFGEITTFTLQSSKTVYSQYYKQFQIFVEKLYRSELNGFFPAQYSDPFSQACILNSLVKYIPAETKDFSQCRKAAENLGVLKGLFVNTAIKEMDLAYESEEFDAVADFVVVLSKCNEENVAADIFKSRNEFATEVELPSSVFDLTSNELDILQFQVTLSQISNFFNSKIELADRIFGESYPVTLGYIENIIANNLTEYFGSQLNSSLDGSLAPIESMPLIYKSLHKEVVEKLVSSRNVGPRLKDMFTELFDLYLEPKILSYLDICVQKFGIKVEQMFSNFQKENSLKEQQQNAQIYKSLRDKTSNQQLIDEKNKFLTSFTKIFKISNNAKTEEEEQLQMAYNLNVMNLSLNNIQVLVSLELCYKVVQSCKNCIEDMRTFLRIRNIEGVVKVKCQEIFKILIACLSKDHFKPGFDKAIAVLEQYDPNKMKTLQVELESMDSQVEPLIKFTELINTGDIVLQMISIFYKNELVQMNIVDKNQDFLNDVVQAEKNFETMVDDYVANGLNVGINKLMDEVLFVFGTLQLPDDFNPDPKTLAGKEIKPSKAAVKNVQLLSNHCFLLTGATDKGTIDIYQQEIGERFFNEIVKNIKKNLISSDGAIFLICDLNYYYDFIANTLKQKNITPFFAGLKTVGQLYLVSGSDSKELGKMICDLGRFQGVFRQEEIYELVQRRTDWVKVRRDVEKVMYGLGVSDCTIM
ncbi:LAME_0G03268g1_1 [Lachancea meyersii CBS 8951]|uniref:LAME_0G03268g1_1 n=1 Tax=Lachancea meyersii CBS 8951 TaxID=1266667 RepID=A0A1G4K6I7_9SACH|nr:LAME_0G03268g1_1 [Lachancea meyersii CBS 8951]